MREEEFGAIKTLKRLDHMNPSVGIDGMNDFQMIFANCRLSVFFTWCSQDKLRGFKIHSLTPINPLTSKDLGIKIK